MTPVAEAKALLEDVGEGFRCGTDTRRLWRRARSICSACRAAMRRWQFQQRSMPTMKRRDGTGRRLTALLDRPTSPALSDGVQRADRSPNVLLEKWALGSVRPFADVSRSSRSFAGG